MADAGVPKTGDIIHADDLKEAVCKISSLAASGVRDYTYNTYAGSSNNIFNSVSSMDAGNDTSLVEKKAVVDYVKPSYSDLLSYNGNRTSGTYTLSQSLDNFDEIEILAASAGSAKEPTTLRVRKGDFYHEGGATPWLINLNLIDVDRRVFITFKSPTSVQCNAKGSTRLVRIVGIKYTS